jgi:hypothetical protein
LFLFLLYLCGGSLIEVRRYWVFFTSTTSGFQQPQQPETKETLRHREQNACETFRKVEVRSCVTSYEISHEKF